jgi:hypothetical protein
MNYRLIKLPGEQIIIGKFAPEYTIEHDMKQSTADFFKMLDDCSGPIYYVMDISQLPLNFGQMVAAMAALTRGELAAFTHPKLLELCVVTHSSMIKLGASALAQVQYGKVNARVFGSVDEAVAYLREKASTDPTVVCEVPEKPAEEATDTSPAPVEGT